MFNENAVEEAALEYFQELGYQTLRGSEISPGETKAERESYEEVFLWGRLRAAIRHINPLIHLGQVDEVIKRVRRAESQSPIDENYRLHKLITEGVPLEYRDGNDELRTTKMWLIDFEKPENNDWPISTPHSTRGMLT